MIMEEINCDEEMSTEFDKDLLKLVGKLPVKVNIEMVQSTHSETGDENEQTPEEKVLFKSEDESAESIPVQTIDRIKSTKTKQKSLSKISKKCFSSTCDHCDEMFESVADAVLHSHRVHWEKHGYTACPEEVYVCDYKKSCQEVFTVQDEWKTHRLKHKYLKRSRKCETCGKVVTSTRNLQMHIDAVHKGIKQTCPHCEFSSGWLHVLEKHIEFEHTHADDESTYKFQCATCGKKFKRPASLTDHELSHNPKSFECSHCGKKFFNIRYRDRHITMVHAEANFACETCGKRFTTNDRLTVHFNSVHLDHAERKHNCTICGQGFHKSVAFRNHMNKHLGLRPFRCPAQECGKSFSDDSSMHAHKRRCPLAKQLMHNTSEVTVNE